MVPADMTRVIQKFRIALYGGSKMSSLSPTLLSEGGNPSCPYKFAFQFYFTHKTMGKDQKVNYSRRIQQVFSVLILLYDLHAGLENDAYFSCFPIRIIVAPYVLRVPAM